MREITIGSIIADAELEVRSEYSGIGSAAIAVAFDKLRKALGEEILARAVAIIYDDKEEK